jgi:ribonuclease HI
MSSNQPLIIYTDGAARGNPGPGGYGAVLLYGEKRREISAGFKLTTNNRMELMAVIEALRVLKKKGLEVKIYTDSQYVMNAIEKGWLKNWVKINFKKKKNADLWREYLKVAVGQNIKFFWVKGHNGNVLNERCDELATLAADKNPKTDDTGYLIQEKNGGTLF